MARYRISSDGPYNSDRAEWAKSSLSGFCENTGLHKIADASDAVSDLIGNLGHYCDQNDLDYVTLVSRAIAIWDVEKREEAEGQHNAMYPEKTVTIVIR